MEDNTQSQPGQQPSNDSTPAPVMDVRPLSGSQPGPANVPPAPAGDNLVQEHPVQAAQKPAKRHGAPVVIIVIALLVATGLAVATIFALKKDKPAAPAQTSQNSQQTNSVTPQTVDDTTAEIDQSLKSVDESTDFPEDELSDQTLGL